MTKKQKRIIVTVLLALIFLVSGGMVVRQQLQYRQIASDSAEAARIAGLPERMESRPVKETAPPVQTAAPEILNPLPEDAAALADLDLTALQEINEDVLGWICIPDTELSYPLLQGEDNQYYLKRNWKQQWSEGGAIYMESTNQPDLSDFHTIVYGHRMLNDTMFGTLKYYRQPDFWEDHPHVYLVTADGFYQYDIFSAHEASVKGLLYRLDLEGNEELKTEFLQYCVDNSAIDTGIVPTGEDQILSLSTCTGTGHAKRWVVQAVLRNFWAADEVP